MAGHHGNYHRLTAGPLAGQVVYVSRLALFTTGVAGMTLPTSAEVRAALERDPKTGTPLTKAIHRLVNKRIPAGQAKQRAVSAPQPVSQPALTAPAPTQAAPVSLFPTSSNPQTVARMASVKKPSAPQAHTVVTTNGASHQVKATMHGPFAIYKTPGSSGWSLGLRHQPDMYIIQTGTKQDALSLTRYILASGQDFSTFNPSNRADTTAMTRLMAEHSLYQKGK